MLKLIRNSPGTLVRWQLTALLLMLTAFSAAAQDSGAIGRIIAIRGQATLTAAAGASRALQLQSGIGLGDLIRTGQRCRLQILFADNTIVSLGPASEFLVKEYAWNAESGEGKMTSRVNEGVFRVLGGSMTKSAPENFLTETPSATIGIRGSMFAGRLHDGALQVIFQGGRGIYISNALGTVDITTPGFGTRLSGPGQAPSKPYKVPVAELEQLDPLAAASGDSGPAAKREPAADEPLRDREEREAATSAAAGEEGQQRILPAPDRLLPTADPPQQPTVEQLAPTSSPQPLATAVAGRFMAVQEDRERSDNSVDRLWIGTIRGQTAAGKLSLLADTNQGLVSIDGLTGALYDPALSYQGRTSLADQERQVSLLDGLVQFNSAAVAFDNGGEFTLFTLNDVFNGAAYGYRELGFAGVPTPALPTSGIDRFSGPLLVRLADLVDAESESLLFSFQMFANWHSGKVLGIVHTPGRSTDEPVAAPGFFFGDIGGSGLQNLQFVGRDVVGPDGPGPVPDSDPGPQPEQEFPLTIGGGLDFGQFYGGQTQGIGLVASGNTYNVLTQAVEEDWLLTAGGFRAPDPVNPSLTGSVIWQGFAVGIAEDMTGPNRNRRVFMNLAPADFSLSVDRDSGLIAGILNVSDQAGSTAEIRQLTIGGAFGSAYVDEDLIAAGLGGGEVLPDGALKPHGNYLINENPARPIAAYARWGSWELAYQERGEIPTEYHLHVPGSLWVAGERTPQSEMQNLIDGNFTATYLGRAEGVALPTDGQMMALTNGQLNLNLDFSAGASLPVSGSLLFDQGGLEIFSSPGDLTHSGFRGALSPAVQSSLQGAFFGPEAASVAGSFDALMSSGERFIGVFGGDR